MKRSIVQSSELNGWVYTTLLFFGALLFLSGFSTTATAQAERTLTVGHLFPPPHYAESVQMDVFAELVEEKSDGRLEVETYPGGELVGGGDALEGVQDGIVDISIVIANFYPEEFIAAQVGVLPLVLDPGQTSMVGAQAAWRALHEPGPIREEWEDQNVVPIATFMTGRYEFFTRDRVETVEDLQGLNIRSAGGLMDSSLEALGATPVGMPPPEQVPALERGVLDGTTLFWSSAHGHGLPDVVDYATHGFQGFTAGFNPWIMNRTTFETLSEEFQQIILEAGHESSLITQRHIVEQEEELREQYREGDDITVVDLDREVVEEMAERVEPVYDQWFDLMRQRGFDGEGVLEQYQELLDESQETPEDWPRYYE